MFCIILKRDVDALLHGHQIFSLKMTNNSYGFSLQTKPQDTYGKYFHTIIDVEEESPARRAGLEDGMILLSINGRETESMKHQAMVSHEIYSYSLISLKIALHLRMIRILKIKLLVF